MASTRQLAAIMFTDIVGYTALMGRDEAKAFSFLEKNRQIQKPLIETFNGIFIKELGDGILARFNTVTDAVQAAIKIQEAVEKEKAFRLRIGIHLGEVVVENEDVFGDGVNIASRIQSAGEPGAITISETVHHNISNKPGFQTRYLKEVKLKNVKDPVRIYEVVTPYSKPSAYLPKKIPGKKILAVIIMLAVLLTAGYFSRNIFQKKHRVTADAGLDRSIAILPFNDISPGKDQAYLGDGIAEEITHSMTIIDDLKVIGTTSSSQFKGKNISAKEIGEKLNVGIVLEGSIQKQGNILRITAQLINVKDNSTIWSQQFDKEFKDIFAIQDSIARHIVDKLKLTLSEEDNSRLTKKTTTDEVYQLYLKGVYTYKQQKFKESIDYFTEAVRKDSLFAPAFAWMALAKTWKIARAKSYTDLNAIHEAKDDAHHAIRLDPSIAEAYSALALMAWIVELDYPEAKLNFEKSLRLNPGASLIKNRYAYFLLWMGEFDKAIELGQSAIRLDPGDYNGYLTAATGLMYQRKFKEADKIIQEAKKIFNSKNFIVLENENLFHSGNYNKLISTFNEQDLEEDDDVIANLAIAYYKTNRKEPGDLYLNKLKQFGETDKGLHYNLARVYLQLGLKDSCFANLERSFVNREINFKLLKIDPSFISLHGDPRYKDLYHRGGFDRYK